MRNKFYIFLFSASIFVASKKTNATGNYTSNSYSEMKNMEFDPDSTSVTDNNMMAKEDKNYTSHTVLEDDNRVSAHEIKSMVQYFHSFSSTGILLISICHKIRLYFKV